MTPEKELANLIDKQANSFEAFEMLYKPLSKLDAMLGVVTRYLHDYLGYSDDEIETHINKILEDWLND